MKATLPAFVIGLNEQVSNEISQLRFLTGIAIYPQGSSTGVVTVQVNASRTGTSGWVNLQSDGLDVQVSGDGVVVISPIPAFRMRLNSSLAEGAERTFLVVGDEGGVF